VLPCALPFAGAGDVTNVEVDVAYRRYAPFIMRRCRRILRDDAAAQDALQEAFCRFWRYGRSLRSSESKLAWLYRVAERCCFDQLTRRRGRSETELAGIDEQLDYASIARDLENRQIVMRFLDRFDERVKEIAVLHYLDEMTQDEIANVTGWSRQTVFKKLTLVRNRAEVFRAIVTRE
jgi:RNA polymerase sigma-70 factor (ECF subfamily)